MKETIASLDSKINYALWWGLKNDNQGVIEDAKAIQEYMCCKDFNHYELIRMSAYQTLVRVYNR
jgi:hypothetical protein